MFEAKPRFLVPVGGMVIGNAMTAAAVALNRLGDEVASQSRDIEATLALGATATEAMRPLDPAQPALGPDPPDRPDEDHRPGHLPRDHGRLAARRRGPQDAVRLQLVLLYALLGAVAIAALTAMALTYRNFFTPADQLREPPARE